MKALGELVKALEEVDDKAKLEAKQKADDEAKSKDIENQKRVYNEILEDLKNVTATFEDERIGYDNAKAIIKASTAAATGTFFWL